MLPCISWAYGTERPTQLLKRTGLVEKIALRPGAHAFVLVRAAFAWYLSVCLSVCSVPAVHPLGEIGLASMKKKKTAEVTGGA